MIFCDPEQVLELHIESHNFDSLLELSKTRSPEISKNKTQNRILKAGNQFQAYFWYAHQIEEDR